MIDGTKTLSMHDIVQSGSGSVWILKDESWYNFLPRDVLIALDPRSAYGMVRMLSVERGAPIECRLVSLFSCYDRIA